jgi:hypothetical protein
MEAIYSSETSVNVYQTTGFNILNDTAVQIYKYLSGNFGGVNGT